MYGTISVQKVILLLLTTVPCVGSRIYPHPLRCDILPDRSNLLRYGPWASTQAATVSKGTGARDSEISFITYYDAHLVKCARVITYLTFVSMNLCGCTKKKSHVHIPWYLNMWFFFNNAPLKIFKIH